MAVKGKLFFLFLVITLVALEAVLACAKYSKDTMNDKIEAITKLNEVQQLLLHDLSTMISGHCSGSSNEGSNSSSGGSVDLRANGLEHSVIVGKNAEHLTNLTNWLEPVAQSEHRWELCWRASRDGWDASTFHSLCDGKGPTVTIIQVAGKYIFGGYISVSWNSGSTGYVSDSNAFLFSLVNNMNIAATKLPVYRNTGNAVYNNADYGPTFGGGHDVYIVNKASSSTQSYSNLGHTFTPPSGTVYSSTKAKTFLAGSYNFQPDEIETFYETK